MLDAKQGRRLRQTQFRHASPFLASALAGAVLLVLVYEWKGDVHRVPCITVRFVGPTTEDLALVGRQELGVDVVWAEREGAGAGDTVGGAGHDPEFVVGAVGMWDEERLRGGLALGLWKWECI